MSASPCPQCRSGVGVPPHFSNGDTTSCDTCGYQLRVLKTDKGAVRLVVADPTDLRDRLSSLKRQLDQQNRDLQTARHSFGIGINGLGLGVLYVVAQMGIDERTLDTGLVGTAIAIAVVVGVGLELANHFFLAKRQAINRLTGEIQESRAEVSRLTGLIREAERARPAK